MHELAKKHQCQEFWSPIYRFQCSSGNNILPTSLSPAWEQITLSKQERSSLDLSQLVPQIVNRNNCS